jgi:hypothetical protein
MKIEKYSIGIGDRFGVEGVAQLRALQKAERRGLSIVPVWNKSNREHLIIGSSQANTREEADDVVLKCNWRKSYYVDADHINLSNVGKFVDSSDFFTIDVANYIGKYPGEQLVKSFLHKVEQYKGILLIPGMEYQVKITDDLLNQIANNYIYSIQEAGKIYRYIAEMKGTNNFVTEISMDETSNPQTPVELFFILAAIGYEGIPIQTIAPKFSGAFLKGIDYVGDVDHFKSEFENDLAVLKYSMKLFDLPENLKISIHSGSDKFSLYPIIHQAINKYDLGLHLKTAGTTWLEEVIGLAASGGDGLALAKEIYASALQRYDELCEPYSSVININKEQLPIPKVVECWSSQEFVESLQHNKSCELYNPSFRQLIHIGYKIAAEIGPRFKHLLNECRSSVEFNVTMNIFNRHIQPLFIGDRLSEKMNGSA